MRLEKRTMSMYIFGDTHGSVDMYKIMPENFVDGRNLTRNDYVVITGDFGVPFVTHGPNWYFKQSDKTMVKKLANLPFTILFVDGNHDNHNFWRVQARQEMFGGRVQKLRGTDNVYHLMRGEYYIIDGISFWTMGGAMSIDRHLRTEGKDWWPGEMLNTTEENHGVETLEKHGGHADVIITHTPPSIALNYIDAYNKGKRPSEQFHVYNGLQDNVARYLDFIGQNFSYNRWFCGHMHIDFEIPQLKMNLLYENPIRLY